MDSIAIVIIIVCDVNRPLHKFVLLPFHEWDLIIFRSRRWSIFRVNCHRGMFADLYFEQKIRIFPTCTIFGARALECLQFFPHNCDSLRRISLSRPFWGEITWRPFHRESNAVNNGFERMRRALLTELCLSLIGFCSFPLLETIFLEYDVHVVVIKMRF